MKKVFLFAFAAIAAFVTAFFAPETALALAFTPMVVQFSDDQKERMRKKAEQSNAKFWRLPEGVFKCILHLDGGKPIEYKTKKSFVFKCTPFEVVPISTTETKDVQDVEQYISLDSTNEKIVIESMGEAGYFIVQARNGFPTVLSLRSEERLIDTLKEEWKPKATTINSVEAGS